MPGRLAIHDLLRTSRVTAAAAEPSSAAGVRDRAQVVVCIVDGTPVPALLPASLVVNLERLLNLTGADEVRLAGEDDGSGPLAAEPIYVDVRLAVSREILLTTDTAAESVVVRWADFARTLRPIVGDFAEPPRDRVGAYRVSARE